VDELLRLANIIKTVTQTPQWSSTRSIVTDEGVNKTMCVCVCVCVQWDIISERAFKREEEEIQREPVDGFMFTGLLKYIIKYFESESVLH